MKNFLIVVASIFVFLFSTGTFAEEEMIFGDTNGDAIVSIFDIQCAIQASLLPIQYENSIYDLYSACSAEARGQAICLLPCLVNPIQNIDYECDGDVDVVDIQAILKIAIGEEESLLNKNPGC